MQYQMEELLPVVTRLSEKYTSKESSSITYETAQMLMEAVVYCIAELDTGLGKTLPAGEKLPPQVAYEQGYSIAEAKVRQAKSLYDSIIEDFEDYGCDNYRQTILAGMPAFFLYYNIRFKPQDHLLTLDYPTLNRIGDKCGIDLIEEYLKGIYAEQRVLCCFERDAVIQVLEEIMEEYEELYMDNICESVLLRIIECAMTENSMEQLQITEKDREELRGILSGQSKEQTTAQVLVLMTILTERLNIETEEFRRGAPKLCALLRLRYLGNL